MAVNAGASGRVALFALTFVLTLAVRVWDVQRHFWMLGDQIRDWSIALGPGRPSTFTENATARLYADIQECSMNSVLAVSSSSAMRVMPCV